MAKYARLRERVLEELPDVEVVEPEPAGDHVLALAHEVEYIDRVVHGRLSALEQRTIGFPWSPQMVERSRRSVGATLGACKTALRDGVAVNLAGGTHHALRGSGQGYCVFNDAAIAARALQANEQATRWIRVAIVDLDVHQGNGTASILSGEDACFTLSIHCEANFPFRKESGDLDIGLAAGTGDQEYLQSLDGAFERMLARFSPDFIIYLAGADPHADDRLGRLNLSTAGLVRRDERVFDLARELDVPIAVAMAGGYGHDMEQTVAVHFNTVCAARDHWRRRDRNLKEDS